MSVIQIQKRLVELGYNPGPIDGIRGKLTVAAVKRFQADNNLVVDGLVGKNTFAKLFTKKTNETPQVLDKTPWMEEALRVMGLHETRNNSALRKWLRLDGATVGDPAVIPWCGDFTQTAILLSLGDEPMVENPYLAANWTKFGIATTPRYGAILSFWRGSPSSWKGHVGFYVGETKDHYQVLGGNQSNAVTKTFIAKNRLRKNGCRWPSTALSPDVSEPIFVDRNGAPVSTNEA